jgi:hypothetical protein
MAALFFYAQPHKTKICGKKHIRKTREIAGFPWWCFQPAGSILNKASNNKATRKEDSVKNKFFTRQICAYAQIRRFW